MGHCDVIVTLCVRKSYSAVPVSQPTSSTSAHHIP